MSKQQTDQKKTTDLKVQALRPTAAPVSRPVSSAPSTVAERTVAPTTANPTLRTSSPSQATEETLAPTTANPTLRTSSPSQAAEETLTPTIADTRAGQTFEPTPDSSIFTFFPSSSKAADPTSYTTSFAPTSGDLKSSQPSNNQQPSFKTTQPSDGIFTNFPSNDNFPSVANDTLLPTSLPTAKQNNAKSSNWLQEIMIGTVVSAAILMLVMIRYFFPKAGTAIANRLRNRVATNKGDEAEGNPQSSDGLMDSNQGVEMVDMTNTPKKSESNNDQDSEHSLLDPEAKGLEKRGSKGSIDETIVDGNIVDRGSIFIVDSDDDDDKKLAKLPRDTTNQSNNSYNPLSTSEGVLEEPQESKTEASYVNNPLNDGSSHSDNTLDFGDENKSEENNNDDNKKGLKINWIGSNVVPNLGIATTFNNVVVRSPARKTSVFSSSRLVGDSKNNDNSSSHGV